MSKKHTKVKVKRAPTKHQMARWQRQKRVQRIATLSGAVFIIFVLLFVGYGYYQNDVKPLQEVAVKVNDVEYDMGYYVSALRIYSQGKTDEAVLSPLADRVVGAIQANELMKQGAAAQGVKVNSQDVDNLMKQLNLPDDPVARDIAYAQVLAGKLETDYFVASIPASGEQVKVQAIVLEGEKKAKEIAAELSQGKDIASLVQEFSVEEQTKSKAGDLGWLPKGLAKTRFGSQVLEDIVFALEPGKISQPAYDAEVTKPFGYWLIRADEGNSKDGLLVQAMLLSSLEEAETVKSKLDLGEDFASLAKLYSQHEASKAGGGNLGKIQPEQMGQTFDKVAFSMTLGTLSQPVKDDTVQTKGGYWVVKVTEKEANRSLEQGVREEMAKKAFDDWLLDMRSKSTIESFVDPGKKARAIALVTKSAKSAS